MKGNKRNTVRLTESQFNRLIAESVKKALNEISWKTYADAASAAADRESIFKKSPTYPYTEYYPEGPKDPNFYKNYKRHEETAYRQSKQPEKFKKAAFAALSREICGEDDFWKYVSSRINNGDVGEDLAEKIKQYQEGEKYIRNNNTKWSVRSLRNESKLNRIVAESVRKVLKQAKANPHLYDMLRYNGLSEEDYEK